MGPFLLLINFTYLVFYCIRAFLFVCNLWAFILVALCYNYVFQALLILNLHNYCSRF